MSETEGIEQIEESEELENSEGIDESIDAEIESNEPDTRSLKEIARDKLKQKLDDGFDLGNKNEKVRICKEIANEIQNIKGSCSYDVVAKEVKYVLKVKKKEKSETTEGIKKVGEHSIKTKRTSKVERPDREETESEESTENLNEFQQKLLVLKSFEDKGESAEEMMIKFALEDVAFFIQALGLPKPQTKRLQARARHIALFNELQRAKGTPENVISISDNILKPLLMIGIFTTFAEPIVKKYFPQADKKKSNDGIKTTNESMRD